jgi:hypothetical protein
MPLHFICTCIWKKEMCSYLLFMRRMFELLERDVLLFSQGRHTHLRAVGVPGSWPLFFYLFGSVWPTEVKASPSPFLLSLSVSHSYICIQWTKNIEKALSSFSLTPNDLCFNPVRDQTLVFDLRASSGSPPSPLPFLARGLFSERIEETLVCMH